MQTAYLAVEECLKITNRRVNALEFIVVPRIEFVVKYIFTELEERSKEDKFKIKKILQVKKSVQERIDLEIAELEALTDGNVPLAFEQLDENDESDEEIGNDQRLFG